MLAKHGPELTEAALEDMRYTDGVVRGALQLVHMSLEFLGVHCTNAAACML